MKHRNSDSDLGVLREMGIDHYRIDELKPRTIIDIGANIGGFAVKMALLHPDARIFAYEPEIENYTLLIDNTIEFPNVRCYRQAVWEHDRGVRLTPGQGLAHVCALDDSDQCKAYPAHPPLTRAVPSITLDQCLASFAHVDLLKIDTEGAEFEILLATTSLHKIRHLRLELHDYFGAERREELWARLCTRFKMREVDVVRERGAIWIGDT